jgi:hypothetical protein
MEHSTHTSAEARSEPFSAPARNGARHDIGNAGTGRNGQDDGGGQEGKKGHREFP